MERASGVAENIRGERQPAQPLVSVVMPFLDVAPYLAEAVESVRAQTYPHWELLLCDDGAADGSTAIARRYAALDPARIRWLEHSGHANLGASATRNRGIREARGDLIAFLDGDDVWLPRKLEEQVALLAAHPEADALVGSTEFWHSWTGDPADAARDEVVAVGLPHGSLVPAPGMLVRTIEGTVRSPGTCSLVARRRAVQRIGGFEESFRRVYTDQVFYAKLFLESAVLVVDTCWDRYRQHPASSVETARRSGELAAVRLRYLHWLDGYLGARGVRDSTVRAPLRRLLWRLEHPHADRVRTRLRRGFRRVRAAAGSVVRAVLRSVVRS